MATLELVWKRFRGLGSDTSLTKKASLNAVASALDYSARVIVGFLLTPLMVRGLGDWGFGVWQVLGQLISYTSPATGRASRALKWTIATLQSDPDPTEKRRQVGSAVAVWILFLPLLAVAAVALAWWAPGWLKAPPGLVWPVRVSIALLMIEMVVSSLGDVPRSVLMGENLGYKRMGLSTLLTFVGAGFTSAALFLQTGLIGVSFCELLRTSLIGVLFLQVARRSLPWFGLVWPERKAIWQFLGLSTWFQLWNLVNKLMRSSELVILGIAASPELVTRYSLTRYAPETILNLVGMVVFGLTPGLGGIVGSGDKLKAQRVRNEMMAFTWLLATAMGATLVLWNHALLRLWVGPDRYAGSVGNFLVMLMVGQFVIMRNDANMIDLTLDLRNKVLLGLLSAGAAVVLGAIAVGPLGLGIVGLCVSFIAGRMLLSLTYPWMVGKFLDVTPGEQLRGVVRPGAVTVLLLGGAAIGEKAVVASSWWSFVPLFGLTLGAAAVLSFYGGLTETQRARLLRRLSRLSGGGVEE